MDVKIVGFSLAFLIGFAAHFAVAHSVEGLGNFQEADQLFASGELENYRAAGEIYAQSLEKNPKDYEAAWKAARAYREYAQNSKEQEVKDWQSVCSAMAGDGAWGKSDGSPT